jgi:hypothetical protein
MKLDINYESSFVCFVIIIFMNVFTLIINSIISIFNIIIWRTTFVDFILVLKAAPKTIYYSHILARSARFNHGKGL